MMDRLYHASAAVASWLAGHPSDDRLLDAAIGDTDADGDAAQDTAAHIDDCPTCAERRDDVRSMMAGLRHEASAAFEATVSPERLARQRRRVMRRIERAIGAPGAARILRFPGFAMPVAARLGRIPVWLGAAAAAGVVLGVTLGQAIDVGRETPAGATATVQGDGTQPGPAPQIARAQLVATGGMGDEQLMRDVDECLRTPRVAPLVALDQMTPRVRDVHSDVR